MEVLPNYENLWEVEEQQGFLISGILETGDKALCFPEVLILMERMAAERRRRKFGGRREWMGIFFFNFFLN